MAQWQKFLLGTSLVVSFAGPLYASPQGENSAVAVFSGAGTQEVEKYASLLPHTLKAEGSPIIEKSAVGTEKAQGQVALIPPCSISPGLVRDAHEKLSVFYPFPAAKVIRNSDGVRAESEGGLLLVDGAQYTLKYIELPKHPDLPADAADYKMEARFVHESAEGAKVILSVPVTEGAPNPGVEMMLQNSAKSKINLNDLLPPDPAFDLAGKMGGQECGGGQAALHYILKTPLQVSAAQLRKFEQLF